MLAPETHQVLLSTANHQSWQPEEHSCLKLARKLQEWGVDFSNASIAIHAYNPRYPKPNSSAELIELMAEFAVINSEANFPKDFMAQRVDNWWDPDSGGMGAMATSSVP